MKRLTLVVLLGALAALVACESDQAVDVGGGDVGGGGDAAAGPPTITVARGADEQAVDLTTLTAETGADGVPRVGLAAVLEAGGATDLAAWLCDFVATDGFQTSTKGEGCEPIPCDRTVGAWVALTTLDVSWDDPNVRGCYRPRGLAKILMTPIAE